MSGKRRRTSAGAGLALVEPMPPANHERGRRPTEIHPAADVFPMLPDDELAALAEDIKQNGLMYPIVTAVDGILIDGRNRLRACEMVGVEPIWRTLNADNDEMLAFIVSMNLAHGGT
jgi:ParB-like chromosome segregation protein Spo0J